MNAACCRVLPAWAPVPLLVAVLALAGPIACGGSSSGGRDADVPGGADVASDGAGDLPFDRLEEGAGDAIPDAGADADVPAAPGFAMVDLESAVALTPDGRTALVWTLADGTFALYDTVTGELSTQGPVGNPQRCMPTAMSATRRVAALHNEPVVAGLWSRDGGWLDLGSLFDTGCVVDPGPPTVEDKSGAFDVSDDGHVAVGLAWDGCTATRAFRWTDGSGTGVFTALDVLGKVMDGSGQAAPFNRASAISGDGTVAAGWAQNGPVDRSPAIWNPDGTGFLLEPDNVDAPGEVKALNADGTLAVGDWAGVGFTWTRAAGVTRLPYSESPFDTVIVNAMTADGTRLFGTVVQYDPELLESTQFGFVWTAAGGYRPLQDVATGAGVAIPPTVRVINVLSTSADGGVVLGTVLDTPEGPAPATTQKSFVLRLPPAAYD